jgi:CDP-6-deoxy-D-xylo-4-hexulose-3-dehydrase
MAYEFPTGHSHWDKLEREAINRVLDSEWVTMGEETAALESEFAAYIGRKYAVATNSGSAANQIATAALFHLKDNPLRVGDRAVVPAIAWATTFAPLVQSGLDLRVADTDATWNAVPLIVTSTPVPRLIVTCPVLGNPAYYAGWEKAAAVTKAYLIEDACESLGASVDGKLCGTFGLMSTFSGFYSHQLSAIELGLVGTNDAECYRLLRMLRSHGWTRDVQKAETFDDEYRFEIFGFNCRPSEVNSAVARVQLRKLPGFIAERRHNYQHFIGLTKDLDITPVRENGFMSPFGFQFSVTDNATRLRLVTALRAASIDCRLPAGGSFLRHPYSARWQNQSTPNADRIHDTGMFLGNPPWPAPDLIERAVAVMRLVL